MAPKYIIKEQRRVYGDTAVTEVDTVTGSVYSADRGVHRHHLISNHFLSYNENTHPIFPNI
jgi:hypothetical protein